MKEMTANDDFERFRTGAAKYAAYLETPEGQLRLDLGATWSSRHVAGFVCTNAGFAMRAAREAGVTERIALKHGDAAQFANCSTASGLM